MLTNEICYYNGYGDMAVWICFQIFLNVTLFRFDISVKGSSISKHNFNCKNAEYFTKATFLGKKSN